MCITDKYPTEYNLRPIKLDEEENGSITEMEQRALRAVDLVEQVSEPVNKFTLARLAVRFVATCARLKRDRF